MWGTTLLAALAVLAAQVIGFLVMRSWLMDRVDQQLTDFLLPRGAFSAPVAPAGSSPSSIMLPSDFRLTFYGGSGHRTGTLGGGRAAGPSLPAEFAALHAQTGRPVTVRATSGGGRWRVVVQPNPVQSGHVVIALPLDTVDGATSKLLWLNAVVLIVTAVGLVAAGRWMVGIGLLPLTRMERTAQDITVGDIGLRVPDTDLGTEIGRLGSVLNTMLDRLEQALRARESSEARLRRFVADAGHELRTPLTSILGFAELRLRHPGLSTQELRESDRLIAQNAERMSLLVDDLLLLAKLDREPEYRRERVDLLTLAADAVNAASPHSRSHPIRLASLPDADGHARDLEVVETFGDPHRLRQVVTNLLTNAITHTPPGTPVSVRVGTASAAAATGTVTMAAVEVADAGPGLTTAQAERVFERFYRADPSRSRAAGGSGLGLAIASAIVEGHGGRLELTTAPGQGCVFRLLLPLRN